MLQTGDLIDGKYKILNKIGGGGMGVVYLALNERLNKTWAIKVAKRDGIHDNNTAIQGLVADKMTLIGLRHPNLPSIVDVYETEQSMMIVMDYIEGKPLSSSVKELGALPQNQVIRWAKQLCDVLGYLHSKNIIYRDMKPSNIMLRPDGDVTLIDFGAAREFKEKNLADTQCLGTIGYAAPEQFGGNGQTDARTDIFCLGATLHHLVTGIDPCQNPSFSKTPIRQINPALSGGLERIIEKCLQDDKAARYQSCAELMYDLEHYEEIDDFYKKKQKKKLTLFAVTAMFTLVFGAVSAFGFINARNRLNADYAIKVATAADLQLSQEERVALYLEAIALNEAETTAYLDMLKLFLSGSEGDGSLTRAEGSVLTQLRAGLNTQRGNGYAAQIYPLETLKARNPVGYQEVCYEIGMAYWYDYETESARYTSAMEWFKEAVDRYPIAKTYVAIGDGLHTINRFAGQNRTEDMYQAYGGLWEMLTTLKNDAENMDNDTKRLVWWEIVKNSQDKAGYFLVTVEKEEMVLLLNEIAEDAEQLKRETQYALIKNDVDEILTDILETKTKINSAGGWGDTP